MKTAFAHEQAYPHLHPHKNVSSIEDALYLILFAILITGIGLGVAYLAKRVQTRLGKKY